MIWIRGNERLLGEGFIVCLEKWEENVCGEEGRSGRGERESPN